LRPDKTRQNYSPALLAFFAASFIIRRVPTGDKGAIMSCVKKFLLPAAAAIICIVAVSGCGRRGAPELPPSAYMQNDKGQMVKKPRPDKPFILDRLIK